MRRILICIVLLVCALAAGAQTTQITASHVAYFGGTTVTGQMCLTPTNQAGQPINIVTPLGQQVSPQIPLCFKINSGVLASNAIVPDTSQTQPVNACYNAVISNYFGAQVAVFPCIQPSGSTWSFDAYVPSSLPGIPALTLPQFRTNGVLNSSQTSLNLVCSGCTESPAGTINIPSSGGSSSAPYVAGAGSVNVLTATFSPPITSLTAGMEVKVLPNLANTTTTPTLNVNGLGAATITKLGTTALVAGDLTTTAVADLIYDGTNWQLQNPQTAGHVGTPSIAAGTGSGTSPTLALASPSADSIGYITLTTGSSPAASAALATVSFGATWTAAPQCFAWPATAATQALVGVAAAQVLAANTTTAHFILTQGSAPLAAATTYQWGYSCGPSSGGASGGGSGPSTLIPNGSTAGSGSNLLSWQGLYNNGSGLAIDTYDCYVQIGSGVNPFSQLVCDHPSGTPGGNQILFIPTVHFAGNVAVQTGARLSLADAAINSSVCTDGFSNLTTSGCPAGGSGAMTPAQFGAHGDGAIIGNGCTTNGTTTIVCSSGPFVSGDVGKQLCVAGAGAAGIGFCSAIATFSSSTTVTASATPSTNVTSAQSSFGHDDVVALQNCFNATSAGVPCVLATPIGYNTPAGYLIVSAGLTIPTKANIQGSASNQGSTIISEFNGDAFSLPTSTASLQAGQPIEAVTLSNFTVFHDPSWPNGRSFHINAAPGVFGFGGMFNSTISDVNSENAAKECLWLDGHINTDDNPNQYITFNQFKCNTADQMHTAAAIKITGIQAQIIFEGGSVDGPTLHSNAPNPLVYLGEKTSGQGDSPVDVKFYGFTCERTTACYSVNNGTNNIHVDNSYIEATDSPLIASNTFGLTFSGNHIANSGNVGAVAQFSGMVSATLHDNFVYGSTPPAAFAVCAGGTNNFNIDLQNNNSTNPASSKCATNHAGTGAALFQTFGTTSTVDASSVVITTIRNPNVSPGKTLTLKALSGGVGSFSLGTGGTPSGNDYPIDLGANASPLVVPAGNSVTLALLDVSGAPVYTLVGGTGLPLTTGTAPTITGCGTISAQHGGTTAGDFTTSTAGTCTAVFALPAAPTGWHCDVIDITKHVATNIMMQSATSTTSCTVTGTTAASDVLSFAAVAY